METKSPSSKHTLQLKTSAKLICAQRNLRNKFRKWKVGSKSFSKLDPLRAAYLKAKSNYQYVRRREDNLRAVSQNNDLMATYKFNRNLLYSKLKKLRGQTCSDNPLKIITPVGTYTGADVLEGFASDAEYLGRARGEPDIYDNEFYRLCKLDNAHIFDFKTDAVKIPKLTKARFQEIVNSEMKKGKACDIHQLTVEHIQLCGDDAQQCIIDLINSIIDNIYYLSRPQTKVGIATCIYKGKNKPRTVSSSYRRITVSPYIGTILDRHIDPYTEQIFRAEQSEDQLGFTKGISYLLASLQRGECQRWAIDHKLTCFGISLDGEAAFPSVDRDIQVRELYSIGERGDLLEHSRNTYQNTVCSIKLVKNLSRTFEEFTGNRQGHVKAAGHFKAYINPCLEAINSANIGFNIGPIKVGAECCADDLYAQTDTPSGLQAVTNIVSHYARRYRVIFNAEKTKIVVTGSRHDLNYYRDISPWSLQGEKIRVVTDNEHLGAVVSGVHEEQKNCDVNTSNCRKSLFSLLGPALSYKCKLSPRVQIHLWRVYSLPVLLSGLAALPVRQSDIRPMQIFLNKILRGFLKQSPCSPVPSLYFLCGELPLEARLHIDLLTLFHNVWSNPSTKIFEIVFYIMKMSTPKSTCWSAHVRLVCQMYNLPDPLALLQQPVMKKSQWKTLIKAKITAYHEADLRQKALKSDSLRYFNVQLLSLAGKPHRAIMAAEDSRSVEKMRIHLKFLTGDMLSFAKLARDRGGNPSCRLCPAPVENIEHILTECKATAQIRERLYPELVNLVANISISCSLLDKSVTPNCILTQFILDPASMNLPNSHRISYQHPRLSDLYGMSRDWCFAVYQCRRRLLKLRNLFSKT